MAFNVYDILGAVNSSGGLTKSSKFLVRITPPRSVAGNISRVISFLCDSAVLPGFSIQTDEVKMPGYGVTEKRPYQGSFNDMPLTFFNDSDGKVLKFFHLWLQSIFNFNLSTNPDSTARGIPMNTVAYPRASKDGSGGYYGIVEIIHYDDAGSTDNEDSGVIKYTLHEAYPIGIGDISMDWNQENTLVKVPVTFVFTYWDAETLDPGQIDYRSYARYNAIRSTATRVDQELREVREILNFTSPSTIQRTTNFFSSLITFL